MKPHIIPLSILSLATAVLVFSFILPTDAQTPPTVSFTTNTLSVEEGRTALLKVRVNTPVTKTTRVRVQVAGATAKANTDYRNPGTVTVTFFPGGLREKSVGIRTIADTVSEGSESFTARVVTVDGKAPLTPVTLPVTIVDKGTSTTGGTTAGIAPLPPRATTTYQGPGTGWTLSGETIPGTGGATRQDVRGFTQSFELVGNTPLVEPAWPIECLPNKQKLDEMGFSRIGNNFASTVVKPKPGVLTPSGLGTLSPYVWVNDREYTAYRIDIDSIVKQPSTPGKLVQRRGMAFSISGVEGVQGNDMVRQFLTVSACPGDLGTDVVYDQSGVYFGKTVGTIGKRCMATSGGSSNNFGGIDLQWNLNPNDPNTTFLQTYGCILDPNKTYYFNTFSIDRKTSDLKGTCSVAQAFRQNNPNILVGVNCWLPIIANGGTGPQEQ